MHLGVLGGVRFWCLRDGGVDFAEEERKRD